MPIAVDVGKSRGEYFFPTVSLSFEREGQDSFVMFRGCLSLYLCVPGSVPVRISSAAVHREQAAAVAEFAAEVERTPVWPVTPATPNGTHPVWGDENSTNAQRLELLKLLLEVLLGRDTRKP
jgi:hypothetical protein